MVCQREKSNTGMVSDAKAALGQMCKAGRLDWAQKSRKIRVARELTLRPPITPLRILLLLLLWCTSREGGVKALLY